MTLVPRYGSTLHYGDEVNPPLQNACLGEMERCVVEQRSAALQREALRLSRQRAFLREERRSARQEDAAIQDEIDSLKHIKRSDWWPSEHLPGSGRPKDRLRLRVGGTLFEVAKDVLERDKGSLLYALCTRESPVNKSCSDVNGGDDGDADAGPPCLRNVAVVDRDWWLFRYITIFLRDGVVPSERSTAMQLYREAAFWRVASLQRAIEETHLNLTRADYMFKDGTLTDNRMDEDDKFWKSRSKWWEPQKIESKDDDPPQPNWWLDHGEITTQSNLPSSAIQYKGRRFGPLSTDPDDVGKITTGFDEDTMEAENDAKPMLRSTWGYYR